MHLGQNLPIVITESVCIKCSFNRLMIYYLLFHNNIDISNISILMQSKKSQNK